MAVELGRGEHWRGRCCSVWFVTVPGGDLVASRMLGAAGDLALVSFLC